MGLLLHVLYVLPYEIIDIVWFIIVAVDDLLENEFSIIFMNAALLRGTNH